MTKAVVPEQAALTETRQPRKSLRALLELGQSVWLDYLRRDLTRSGELAGMVADGVRGMTSNQTILEQAIAGSADYDDALFDIAMSHSTDSEAFEALAIQDVQEAAAIFRQVYDETDVLYVESLIGPTTNTTVPSETLRLFQDHGVVEQTLPGDVSGAPADNERVGVWRHRLRRRETGARGGRDRNIHEVARQTSVSHRGQKKNSYPERPGLTTRVANGALRTSL